MKFRNLCLAAALLAGPSLIASPITYIANLDGASESPANGSPGVGFATVIIDTIADTLYVSVAFQDLLGTTTASHIHCCTAAPLAGTVGVATATANVYRLPGRSDVGVLFPPLRSDLGIELQCVIYFCQRRDHSRSGGRAGRGYGSRGSLSEYSQFGSPRRGDSRLLGPRPGTSHSGIGWPGFRGAAGIQA